MKLYRAVLKAERKRFLKALAKANYSREKAAQLLKISRATYFRRAKELGLVSYRKEVR